MPQPLKTTVAAMVQAAKSEITELAPADVTAGVQSGTMTVIDIRDIRELQREGKVVGAHHVPRGMLEFWVDPDSPYYKEKIFGDAETTYVLHCASGWRSALATKVLQDMGMDKVAHIEGGFTAWKDADGPIEAVEAKG